MDFFAKCLLTVVYPLFLCARFLEKLFGRDPLRMIEPRSDSHWIPRGMQPDLASYFSEASIAEARGAGGIGWMAAVPLRGLASIFGTRRTQLGEKYMPSVDREQGIPDEVYTLW